jgi:hypothetical protein
MNVDFQSIATYGTFLFMGVAAIALWYNGRSQKKSDGLEDATKTIQLLNQRIDAQDVRIAELQQALGEEHDKRVRLEEQIRLKDQTIKEYLDILQNRDPALAEYIKNSSKALESLVAGVSELLKSERSITVTTKTA